MIDDPIYLALIRACEEKPFEDVCRFALADWLEENGLEESARFYRTVNLFGIRASVTDLGKTLQPFIESVAEVVNTFGNRMAPALEAMARIREGEK